jgi:hypothetical protein
MLKTFAAIIPVLGALALAACQPEPTPEQKAAAELQKLAQQMGAALGADGNITVDPEALGKAMAQAGAMAGAMDSNMSAEDRAKLNAITGAMASGQVHPAAAAYVAGLDKAFTIVSTVKDDASAAAAKVQLAPVYAEMAPAAAALKAMSEHDREVAFGSAYPQFMGFGLKMAGLMMPLMNNPELADKVSDLLDDMPDPE